jgi:hypothetical protein
MPENKSVLPKRKKSNGVHMQADIVDQINTNQQSNMALCLYSVITQSCSTVKLNGGGSLEVEQ